MVNIVDEKVKPLSVVFIGLLHITSSSILDIKLQWNLYNVARQECVVSQGRWSF